MRYLLAYLLGVLMTASMVYAGDLLEQMQQRQERFDQQVERQQQELFRNQQQQHRLLKTPC